MTRHLCFRPARIQKFSFLGAKARKRVRERNTLPLISWTIEKYVKALINKQLKMYLKQKGLTIRLSWLIELSPTSAGTLVPEMLHDFCALLSMCCFVEFDTSIICRALVYCLGSFLLQDLFLSLQVFTLRDKIWHLLWTCCLLACYSVTPDPAMIRTNLTHE